MKAPRPFWDRDVLQRRWQLPLDTAHVEGVAIVMRSFLDNSLQPEREDRVRANVHKAGYLLRPLANGSLHVVACQQLDMGGLCPPWAQAFLTKMLVQRGVTWSEKLQVHCAMMREQRARDGRVIKRDEWRPRHVDTSEATPG